jgi:CheY-like chemotaxis protein
MSVPLPVAERRRAPRPRSAPRALPDGWVVLRGRHPAADDVSGYRMRGGEGAPGPAQPPGAPGTAGPVLVVDDDPAILATVAETLELEGYPVVTARNGAEALRCIEGERPSLLLLDMRMPVLDGWGLARELRARGIAVPLLVMTAAQDARRWAEQIGAAGYLAKPFDLDDLLDTVARLRPRANDEIRIGGGGRRSQVGKSQWARGAGGWWRGGGVGLAVDTALLRGDGWRLMSRRTAPASAD